MKKNNAYLLLLLGVVALSGINFEARGMENPNKALLAGGLVTVALGSWYLKNTATYKTYDQHNARLATEKAISDNPFEHAQPLMSTGLGQEGEQGNEKLKAFLKKDEEERNAYNQQIKKNDPHWNKKQVIEEYKGGQK